MHVQRMKLFLRASSCDLYWGKKCTSEEVCCNDLNSAFVDRRSLQEWELEEWDENHAKFAFFMKTVELETSFGPVPAGEYKAKGLRNSESTGLLAMCPAGYFAYSRPNVNSCYCSYQCY